MDAYTGFAALYDTFMDNIPYKEWSNYVINLLKQHNINDGIVLDLGCGTGNIAEYLATAGYDMIGIDYLEAGGCAVRASPVRLGSLAQPQRRGTSP